MRLVYSMFFIGSLTSCSLNLFSDLGPVTEKVEDGQRTTRFSINDRLRQYGSSSRSRILPLFLAANVSYPPVRVTFVALKQERIIEVYAGNEQLRWIADFPICAASGTSGPKLQEGDRQVPEGIYSIAYLNPNSRFHLSLALNYPNEFDRAMGLLDGRSNIGADIVIHGDCCSHGCLSVGNDTIEDFFVLAADTGIENLAVIIAPYDLRKRSLSSDFLPKHPVWVGLLYSQIGSALQLLRH